MSTFDPTKHPRKGAGQNPGEWASKDRAGAAGSLAAEHDLQTEIESEGFVVLTSSDHPGLAAFDDGYSRLVVGETKHGDLAVTGYLSSTLAQEFGWDDTTSEGQALQDAFVDEHGDALQGWLDDRHESLGVDDTQDWPDLTLRVGAEWRGEATAEAADDALRSSDAHEVMRRLRDRGGIEGRFTRWQETGQSTLDSAELDRFMDQYLATALWSSDDIDEEGSGEPLDAEHDITDIDPTTVANLRTEVVAFLDASMLDIERALDRDDYDSSRLAHDLWLTRNGHGAGFWDRGFGALGDRLTAAARPYGSTDMYIGDDGRVYASGYEQVQG